MSVLLPHIISEEVDRMRDAIEKVLVSMGTRNPSQTRDQRVETRITLVLKGDLTETETRLQKIYKGIVE